MIDANQLTCNAVSKTSFGKYCCTRVRYLFEDVHVDIIKSQGD